MILPSNIKIYGDIHFRDKSCRKEWVEQKDFIGRLKEHRPNLHKLAVHPKNEGLRTGRQATIDEEQGALNKGAVDIIIPCRVPFVAEMKRVDRVKSSKLTDEQIKYLVLSESMGAFSLVALGCDAMWEALLYWEQKYLK